MVGESEYGDKAEALQAYAKVLDEHLHTMTAVRYAVGEKCVACPLAAGAMAKATGASVKYRVASATFVDKAEAEKAASAAREAAGKVTLPSDAGNAKRCDTVNAAVELAKARIAAAQQAVEAVAAKRAGGTEVAGA